MSRHVVAKAADLPIGQRLRVVVAGRAVLLLNIKGELFALSDTCPHKGASLAGGTLTGQVTSTGPGAYTYTRQGEIIRCPWHQWEFDVRTGRSWCDPRRMRLAQYPVAVEAPTAPLEGPYRAETYPVSVTGPDIVVELP